MKSLIRVGVAAVLAAAATVAIAQEKPKGAEKPKEAAAKSELPKCIVMGDDTVDVTVKHMTDSGPIYFCCPDCIDTYKKEPAKYADKIKAQQAAMKKLDRVQVTCPLDSEAIDKKAFSEKDGQKVYFCCDKCKGKYEAEPAKYTAKLEGSYTYQTKCPVMGKTIDPGSHVDLATGQRIYTCCMMCAPKLSKDPEKYVANLQGQGVNIDPAKLKGGGEKKEEKKDEKKP